MGNRNTLDFAINLYLDGDLDKVHEPLASPLKASFADLPPMKFIVGSTEMVLDDSLHACRKAEEAGVIVECDVWEKMPHCFPIIMPHRLPEARRAIADIANFLHKHLGMGSVMDAPTKAENIRITAGVQYDEQLKTAK